MSTDTAGPDTATLLRALIALQIAERQERMTTDTPRPTEVVLADVGIGLGEISLLTGRKYETVKATIRRARAADKSADKSGPGRAASRKA